MYRIPTLPHVEGLPNRWVRTAETVATLFAYLIVGTGVAIAILTCGFALATFIEF